MRVLARPKSPPSLDHPAWATKQAENGAKSYSKTVWKNYGKTTEKRFWKKRCLEKLFKKKRSHRFSQALGTYALPGQWPLACAANNLLQRRAQHSKDAVIAQRSPTPPKKTATAANWHQGRHTLTHTPEHTARAAASPRTHQEQDPPLGGHCHPGGASRNTE